MQKTQAFQYDRPSLDSLSGIYVEASDAEKGVEVTHSSPEQKNPTADVERLFGFTLTVDDTHDCAPGATSRGITPNPG